MAFQFENNIELNIGGQNLSPIIYHYERGFELGKKQRFLFAFQIPEQISSEEATFVFYDNIFNTGKNNFKFSVIEEKTPQLPINIKSDSA